MQTYAYVRVSTREQNEDRQLAALEPSLGTLIRRRRQGLARWLTTQRRMNLLGTRRHLVAHVEHRAEAQGQHRPSQHPSNVISRSRAAPTKNSLGIADPRTWGIVPRNQKPLDTSDDHAAEDVCRRPAHLV